LSYVRLLESRSSKRMSEIGPACLPTMAASGSHRRKSNPPHVRLTAALLGRSGRKTESFNCTLKSFPLQPEVSSLHEMVYHPSHIQLLARDKGDEGTNQHSCAK